MRQQVVGDADRDPVRLVAGGEQVAEFQFQLAAAYGRREAVQFLAVRRDPADVLFAHAQEVVALARAQLAGQGVAVVDQLQPLVVELKEHLLVDHDVAAAEPLLHLLELVHQVRVVLQEGVAAAQLAVDQGLADEDLTCLPGGFLIDAAVLDPAAGHDGQPEQAHPLGGQHPAALLLPVRVGPAALAQFAAEPLQPVRLDGRHGAGEQLGGLDELAGHGPLRPAAVQARAREQHHLPPAGGQIVVFLLFLADVAEKAARQRDVDGVVAGRCLACAGVPVFAQQPADLLVHVQPFAHALPGEEVGLAVARQLRARGRPGVGCEQTVPDVEQGEEVGFAVEELAVHLVRLVLLVRRPHARVLDGERRGEHNDLPGRAQSHALDDDARDARVERQSGHEPAVGGEAVFAGERPQLTQGAVAVADGRGRRRVDEGEAGRVAQAQADHLQDDLGQVGALDLGHGERFARLEILLAVETHAEARAGAAAAAAALFAAGLRDAADAQAGGAGARVVAGDARQPGVDHGADARHGDRGLGHVGGDDDLASVRGPENLALVGRGQPAEQGQEQVGGVEPLAQPVQGVGDVPFGGHEHEDVAAVGPVGQFLHRTNGPLHVGGGLALLVFRNLLVDGGDRKGAAAHGEHRRVAEMAAEALRVDGGRADDQLQVRPGGQQVLQVAEQEIDVQAALVRLVDDERVVAFESRVLAGLGKEHAIGHELDQGIGGGPVVEADLGGDPVRGADLLGQPVGHGQGGDAPRLGAADQPGRAAAGLEAHLGQLGGLAAAGVADDDEHRVVANGGDDIVAPLAHRQGGGIGKVHEITESFLRMGERSGYTGGVCRRCGLYT